MAARKLEKWSAQTAAVTFTTTDLNGKIPESAEKGDEVPDAHGKNIGILVRDEDSEGKVLKLPMTHVMPRPDQPRTDWKGDEEGLIKSILHVGQQEHLRVVRMYHYAKRCFVFLIISGERRYRGLLAAKAKEATAISEWDPKLNNLYERAYFANAARRDLNPIEDAEALARIIEARQQNETAKDEDEAITQLGRETQLGEKHIRERLELLDLVPEIQGWVRFRVLAATPALRIVRRFRQDAGRQKVLATMLKQDAAAKNITAAKVEKVLRKMELQGGEEGIKAAPAATGEKAVTDLLDSLHAALRDARVLVESCRKPPVKKALGDHNRGAKILVCADEFDVVLGQVREAVSRVVDNEARPLLTRTSMAQALRELLRKHCPKDCSHEDLLNFKKQLPSMKVRTSEGGPARRLLEEFEKKLEMAIARKVNSAAPKKKTVGLRHHLEACLD